MTRKRKLGIVIILVVLIGALGHIIPIKSYDTDPGSPLVPGAKKAVNTFRVIQGQSSDYSHSTKSLLDNLCSLDCGNTVNKLYLW